MEKRMSADEVGDLVKELSWEERAVLIAWHPDYQGDDPVDYPESFSDEFRVMEALQKRGLFEIEEVDSDFRYYTTDAGRQVAERLSRG
jgi:hypothetical protein